MIESINAVPGIAELSPQMVETLDTMIDGKEIVSVVTRGRVVSIYTRDYGVLVLTDTTLLTAYYFQDDGAFAGPITFPASDSGEQIAHQLLQAME